MKEGGKEKDEFKKTEIKLKTERVKKLGEKGTDFTVFISHPV